MRPIVLTVAGSDPSGGAGILADVKTIEALGGWGCAVVAVITAQNTRGVRRVVPVEAGLLADQLDAVVTDLDPAAIKSGALGGATQVELLADRLRRRPGRPYVLDPVMRSTSGADLLDRPGVDALRQELLPLASLVTPNAPEAERLTGLEVRTVEQARRAGLSLLDSGASAVLVTGGHLRTDSVIDLLVTRDGSRTFEGRRLDGRHGHGTGCLLSAAIATRLAHGDPLERAVSRAREFVAEAIRHGLPLGGGSGPADPMHGGIDRRRPTPDAGGRGPR